MISILEIKLSILKGVVIMKVGIVGIHPCFVGGHIGCQTWGHVGG